MFADDRKTVVWRALVDQLAVQGTNYHIFRFPVGIDDYAIGAVVHYAFLSKF